MPKGSETQKVAVMVSARFEGRCQVRRVLCALAATAVGVSAPLLSFGHSAAAPRHRGPGVHAILTLAPGTAIPWRAPGVKVVRAFPHIGAEEIVASPARLHALSANRAVLGVSRNWRGHMTDGGGNNTDRAGVLASKALGGATGKSGVGSGATVALVDTGVNDTPALNRASGRLIDGIDTSRLSSGGDASTSGNFTDGYGHGTFMASLIAGGQVPGSGNLGLGVAPAAHVVVVKVADSSGQTSLLQILAALDWVAVHSDTIRIANLSLSVDRPTAPAYGADPLSAAVEHLREDGVLSVVSVGNTPGQVGDPGMDPKSLTVGAADADGAGKVKLASFSGYGVVDGMVKPDVVAPGLHILGEETANTAIGQANPQAFDGFGLFRGSGTSEATALTSGVAAAYLSAYPDATAAQLKSAVRVDAQDIGNWRAGNGLVAMTVCRGHGRNSCQTDDPSGEASFDRNNWNVNAWQGGGWQQWLDDHWSAGSWSASSWSASSWSAGSWSAGSWSAGSWSASSWSASSWSASSWSASSWSDAGWGDDGGSQ
jgi:serine protease AprX